MSVREPMLTDEQWAKIEPLIPKTPKNPKGSRPPSDDRECLEGILWILRSGARWKDLPEHYPHYSTCHRRLQAWHKAGVIKEIWRAFLSELDHDGILDRDEAFVDARFIPAKKRGKGTKYLVVVDGQGIPLGSHTASASPAEIKLLESVMQDIKVSKKGPGRPRARPKRVIGDKAYDSDPHRKQLRKRGINFLAPASKES